ncbi:MAG: hypothetical protein U1E41_06230 [Paracoccus sp. (in: a-proteobacteria)]
MLPILQNSMRLVCRSHLLLTTALISVAPMAFVGGMARAQEYYLDNAAPGGTSYETQSGTWNNGSDIWTNSSDGSYGALPADAVGILTSTDNSAIVLTLNGNISAGGLRVDSGQYTLQNGTLRGGTTAGLSFLVAQGQSLTINSDIEVDPNVGQIVINRPASPDPTNPQRGGLVRFSGDTQGQIDNNGSLLLTSSHDGSVTTNSGALTALSGTINGGVTNSGTFNLAGTVTGAITNNDLMVTTGTGGRATDLTNSAGASVFIGPGQTLTVDNQIANSGVIRVGGDTGPEQAILDADVNNAAGATLRLVNGGRVQGAVDNAGTVTGSGRIAGTITNSGTVTVNAGDTLSSDQVVQNQDTINIAGTLASGIANDAGAQVNMTNANASITGNVLNRGVMSVQGTIGGRLEDRGSVVTSGNVQVGSMYVGASGNTTINANHTLTANQRVTNYGTTTIAGTLSGDILNDALGGYTGTLVVAGGTIDGDVANAGLMNARGDVTGAVSNSGILNTTGDLSVGSLTNQTAGTVTVAAGSELSADGVIANRGRMNVNGDVTLSGANQLRNDATGTLVLSGANITGSVTNDGDMNVINSSTINGSLTNNDNLSLTSDAVAGQDVTLTVTNDFSNRGTVDGTGPGSLTIQAGTYSNRGGTVTNVDIIGNTANYGTLNYTEDASIQGSLTNMTGGSVTVSAGLDMTNHNIVNNGNFLVTGTTAPAGDLTNVTQLTNNATFTIENGGRVTATAVTNGQRGAMTIGGTLVSSLTNAGSLTGNGTVTGALVNHGTMSMTGTVGGRLTNGASGTGTLAGRLQVGSMENSGDYTVNAGGVLQSGETIANSGGLAIAGQVVAALNNTGTTTLAGTGSISGSLTNSGSATIAGTVAGRVINTGTALQPGTLTLAGGSIGGPVTNGVNGRLGGNGTINNTLENAGTAELGGRVTGLVTNTGTLTSAGTLAVAGLSNAANGEVNVATGSTLQSGTEVQNGGALNVHGTLAAGLNNAGTAVLGGAVTGAVANSGTTTLAGGTISGAVTNAARGTLNGTGTINNTLANAGTATLAGRVTGQITNTGTLNVAQGTTLRADQVVQNNRQVNINGALAGDLNNTANAVIGAGGSLNNLTNAAGGSVTSAGNIAGLTNAGTATLTSSSDTDHVANVVGATLTGAGTIGTLSNNGTATIGGRVDALTNGGTLNTQGALSAGALTNNELMNVNSGSTLTMDDGARLLNNDRLVMAGGTIAGAVTNAASGAFSGTGTVNGTLTNAGTVTVDDRLTIDRVVNNNNVTITGQGTLISGQAVQNNALLTVAGRLQGDLANSGTAALNGGTIIGNVANAGALTGTGTIDGTLRNSNIASIGGTVTNLVNLSGGHLTTDGDLAATSFTNSSTNATAAVATIREGTTLTVANIAENGTGGELEVAGTLAGALNNAGTLTGGGAILGAVNNTGIARFSGRIGGDLANGGVARLSGSVNGNVVNQQGGRLTTTGDLEVGGSGGVTNASGGQMNIAANTSLTTAMLTNQSGGNLSLAGTMNGAVANAGRIAMTRTGVLNGTLTTSGYADLSGFINGGLIYQGGTLLTGETFRVGGDFRLESDYTVGAGREINAGRTVVTAGNTLNLNGALVGALLNNGRVETRGDQASVSGQMTNNNVVSLSNGAGQGNVGTDVLTVGGLAGSGTYYLDVDTLNATADRIVVDGGAATGTYRLELNFLDPTVLLGTGNRLTLIDVDESAANGFTVIPGALPEYSAQISYSIDRAPNYGDVSLVAQTNAAIGAIFGNVALVQSLIGSVINRPTSPYVTALAYEDKEKPCGVGSWGRVTGGHAKATGATDNGVSVVDSEVTANYYGMQVGTDLACFDDRFGGWDMAFGMLGGINRGNTSQPVYGYDANNSQVLSNNRISTTSTDFEQRYIGAYVTATQGPWQADLQYRLERTDFTISNKGVGGNLGLGLDDYDFSSDGYTLSGSLSYGMLLDNGWAVVPTVGFAWSKMSTDSIPFSDDYRLTFDDSTRKVGFVGATVAKTFVQPNQNAALSTFATATWYKDFADPTVSVFSRDGDAGFAPQRLKSDNLGSYGEISLGANWIKVLGPRSRGRQLSAGARIDARFGDQLDSVGVSGQVRWQF